MTHNIAAPPIQEIEVVIIHHLWGIKYFLWRLWQRPEGLLLEALAHILGVDAHITLIARRRGWRLKDTQDTLL